MNTSPESSQKANPYEKWRDTVLKLEQVESKLGITEQMQKASDALWLAWYKISRLSDGLWEGINDKYEALLKDFRALVDSNMNSKLDYLDATNELVEKLWRLKLKNWQELKDVVVDSTVFETTAALWRWMKKAWEKMREDFKSTAELLFSPEEWPKIAEMFWWVISSAFSNIEWTFNAIVEYVKTELKDVRDYIQYSMKWSTKAWNTAAMAEYLPSVMIPAIIGQLWPIKALNLFWWKWSKLCEAILKVKPWLSVEVVWWIESVYWASATTWKKVVHGAWKAFEDVSWKYVPSSSTAIFNRWPWLSQSKASLRWTERVSKNISSSVMDKLESALGREFNFAGRALDSGTKSDILNYLKIVNVNSSATTELLNSPIWTKIINDLLGVTKLVWKDIRYLASDRDFLIWLLESFKNLDWTLRTSLTNWIRNQRVATWMSTFLNNVNNLKSWIRKELSRSKLTNGALDELKQAPKWKVTFPKMRFEGQTGLSIYEWIEKLSLYMREIWTQSFKDKDILANIDWVIDFFTKPKNMKLLLSNPDYKEKSRELIDVMLKLSGESLAEVKWKSSLKNHMQKTFDWLLDLKMKLA